MILGSHNSWSYLPVKKWWMKPIAFTARCQRKTIREQYELGVRCFDLRVRFYYGQIVVAHGIIEYAIDKEGLLKDLEWIDSHGGCYVRVLHEVRTKRQYETTSKMFFESFCYIIQSDYKNIRFWCGHSLCNWSEKDYDFGNDPECEEHYASVSCKWLAWWPWLYARLHNSEIREQGTTADILLIDYVNIK